MARDARRIRLSLRWISTGMTLVLLVLFGLALASMMSKTLAREIEGQLERRGMSLASLLGRNADYRLFVRAYSDVQEDVESVQQEEDVLFVAVTDDEGNVVAKTVRPGFNDKLGQYLNLFNDPGKNGHHETDLFVAKSDIYMTRASRPAGGDDELDDFGILSEPEPASTATEETFQGRAFVGLTKKPVNDTVAAARKGVTNLALGLGFSSAIIALLVALVVTRPLGLMVRNAVAMSHGDYESVSDVHSPTKEVGELADAFAVMRGSLAMVADQARSIAAGDLSRRVSGAGQLGEAFNAMVESLSALVGQIKQASIQIASASSEILASSKQSEKGSAEQASSINQTTTTMDELLSASKQIATSADAVVQIAERTLTSAKAGEEAVQESVRGMEEIANNNRQTAERILELSERNQQIGNIVDLIDEIADKSDLLALNAAIEGAKAGEAGKGFAVVATEMRSLAENVVESTKEIKSLISEIQKASNASVLATEGQMKATERGTHVAVRTGEQLQKILQMVEQTTEAAKQISLATQQQRTGTEQVVQSMTEIAKIAKSNVSGAAQTTGSAVELSNLATDLKQAVSQFRLESDQG